MMNKHDDLCVGIVLETYLVTDRWQKTKLCALKYGFGIVRIILSHNSLVVECVLDIEF